MQQIGTETMQTASTIGAWLKQRRLAVGLTQQALAERTGYALSTIRKVESGVLRPSPALAERLAEVLALTPEEHARLRADLALPGAQAPALVEEHGDAIRQRFEVLPRPLQQLVARLVVLAVGGTLGTVHAVCAPETDIEAVETDVRALVAAGFLQQEFDPIPGDAAEQRFSLPDALRALADQSLSGDDRAVTRERHAHYFLRWTEHAARASTGLEQRTWLRRIEREHDNLRTALGFALEHHQVETALRFVVALGRFWWTRGHAREGRRWLEQALQGGGEGLPGLRATASYWLGVLAARQGEHVAATAALLTSRALYAALGDRYGVGLALNALGMVANARGAYAAAAACYDAALEIYRALGDRERIATLLNNRGYTALLLGDMAHASTLLAASLALAQELKEPHGIAFARTNLGLVALRTGDDTTAPSSLLAGLAVFSSLAEARGSAEALEALGELAYRHGEHERAARLLGAAEGLRSSIDAGLAPHEQPYHAALVDAIRGALGEQHWVEAWAAGQAMSLDQAASYAWQDQA